MTEIKKEPENRQASDNSLLGNEENDLPSEVLVENSDKDKGHLENTVEIEDAVDSSEDILFPMEGEVAEKARSPLTRIGRGLLILLLLGFVFLLGYGTQPEVLNRWKDDVQGWLYVGVEKAKPLGKEMYKRTVGMVDKIHGPKNSNEQGTGSATVIEGGKRKVKYWKAPMTSGYKSDRPGKSPMGMDLIPVYEGEDEGGVSVNPVMVQNIGVKTEVAENMAMRREIRTVARLTYDERMIHHIHTKYGGWIEKLYVDFKGQEVNKGDLLMEIYSPELVSTQEELVVALKYAEALQESTFSEIRQGASRLLESTKKRLELFDVPHHQIDELLATRKIKKTMHIHSPVKGVVVHKKAEHGMHVEPGKPLYSIANLSNIWVLADIYEYEVPWVKLGQEAEMTLAYFPGKIFKGKVAFIDPFLDPESRTLKVRIEFKNPTGALKPEMYANVILKEEITKRGVAIPEEAIIYTGEKTIVVVQRPKGGFESREVSLGVTSAGFVQILKGVKEGERIVTSSTFLIDSESRLNEALGKLGGKLKPLQEEGDKQIILKEAQRPPEESGLAPHVKQKKFKTGPAGEQQ